MTRKLFTQSSQLATIALVISLLICGCTDDISAGGPGTGGTGPLATTSTISLWAMNSKTSDGNGSDGLVTPSPSPSPSPSPISNDNDTTWQVSQLDKSIDEQYCGGFRRSISLVKDKQAVNQLIFDAKSPISIEVIISNHSDSELLESQQNCHAFDISNHQQQSILNRQLIDCALDKENILFLPNQTHTYRVNILGLNQSGQYRIAYQNQVANMDGSTETTCPTYLDVAIEQK